jgi:hypothetical protein
MPRDHPCVARNRAALPQRLRRSGPAKEAQGPLCGRRKAPVLSLRHWISSMAHQWRKRRSFGVRRHCATPIAKRLDATRLRHCVRRWRTDGAKAFWLTAVAPAVDLRLSVVVWQVSIFRHRHHPHGAERGNHRDIHNDPHGPIPRFHTVRELRSLAGVSGGSANPARVAFRQRGEADNGCVRQCGGTNGRAAKDGKKNGAANKAASASA